MAPYDRRKEVTIAPASAQQTMPVTIGSYGPPEGAHQSLPVFKPGPGYRGTYPPALGAEGRTPIASAAAVAPPVAPPLSGTVPKTGGTAPMNASATLLPEGVMPWGPGAVFNDPNSGRERLFATPEQAASAHARLASPAGQEQSRAELIQHLSSLAAEGTPAVSPNYQLQPGQEGSLRLTPQEFGMLPQSPPVAPPLDSRQTTRPARNSGEPSGFEPNRKIEIIRVESQVYNVNPQGKSADEIYREQVTDSLLSNLSAGVGTAGPAYSVDKKGNPTRVPNAIEHLQELDDASRKGLPSLEGVKAGRASELLKDPSGISEADRLLFGKSQGEAKPGLYKEEILDEYGAKTGEVPYLYDNAGNATPLKFPEGESPQSGGRPAGYPDAYQARKPDGKPGWFVKRKGKTLLISQ